MEEFTRMHEQLRKLNVLYVEDEKIISEKIAMFLENFFDRVDCAYDGAEGLTLFEEKAYDVVITDIQMPRLDGFGMLERMQGIRPDIFYCILSATDIEIPGNITYDSLVPKPMSLEDLLAMMRKIDQHLAAKG